MNSIYRSTMGRAHIRRWCSDQLDAWPVPHERSTWEVNGEQTHVVTAGAGSEVVVVPGTNFNAATSLPLATALVAAGHRVALLDVPGQPGLSSGRRMRSSDRRLWYGTWLSEAIEQISTGPVTVVGHSLGAAIALSCESPRIERLILASPGGLTRLRMTPSMLITSAAWFLRPTATRSARLLRAMLAPGHLPRKELVEWMTLVALHARSTAAPGTVRPPVRSTPRLVVTGAHDVFLPPRRLGPAVRTTLGVSLDVVDDAGHLMVEEQPEYLAVMVDGAAWPDRGGPEGRR